MYHSTPAARPASTIVEKGSVPSPGGASCAVLHVEESDPVRDGPDLGDRVAPTNCRPIDIELQLDLRRELGEEDVPHGRGIQLGELEGVVVVAKPDSVSFEGPGVPAELGAEAPDVVRRPAIVLRHRRHDDARA